MKPVLWIVLSMVLFAVGEAASKYWANKPNWRLIVLAIAAYIACEIPWLIAIRQRNHLTTMGTIWSMGAVITTVLLGVFLFHEEATPQQWFGIILALIACWLMA